MKKYIPLFTVLTVITVIVTSFRLPVVAPKPYPELEGYLKAIDAKKYPKEKYPVLENLRQNINACLSKIGYKITKGEKEGKTTYEVKYSDDVKPILLYAKTTADSSLPKQEVTSVVVCDRAAEPVCKDLKTANYSFELPFQNINADQSDAEVESTLKNIAIAMKFVTEKKAPK